MDPMDVETAERKPILHYTATKIDQTNGYITDASFLSSHGILAVAVSDRTIRVYVREGPRFSSAGTIAGHAGAITGIIGREEGDPSFLSSSEDGTVRLWSLASFSESLRFSDASNKPIHSCCAIGKQVVGGSSDVILVWESNKPTKALKIQDAPDGEVTQVLPHQDGERQYIVSGDQGGTVTVLDLAEVAEEDEGFRVDCPRHATVEGGLDGVGRVKAEASLNTGHPVRRIGLYGRGKKKLWCLSDDHHVTMWELDEALDEEGLGGAGPLAPPQDCREEMTKACTSIGADMALGADISYVIDLLYNEEDDQLHIVGGTSAGGCAVYRLHPPEAAGASYRIGGPWAVFPRAGGTHPHGHHGVVRCVCWISAEGKFITGGEDGAILQWLVSPQGPTSCDVTMDGSTFTAQQTQTKRKLPITKKKERQSPYQCP